MSPQIALIPIDGSEMSRHSIDQVCHLLDPRRVQIVLLRVAEPQEGAIAPPPRPIPIDHAVFGEYENTYHANLARHPIYPAQVEDSIRARLEAELMDDIHRLQDSGFVTRSIVRFGDPVRTIAEEIDNTRADMVVMATHGRSGVRRLMLGSVAEQVLRASPVPVLLIGPGVQDVQQASAAPHAPRHAVA